MRQPDWYLQLESDLQRLMHRAEKAEPDERQRIKDEVYGLVEELIAAGELYIGAEGPDFDADREKVDAIVIHHTSNAPGMSLSRLNAMHLLRLYVGYFSSPVAKADRMYGQPLYSGHYYKESQVFWGYHWLVRQNGESEHLLDDDVIGWHAGDWEVNCRSIAICFDGDLTRQPPSDTALVEAARIIRSYKKVGLYGHRECNPQTVCPGDLFMSEWKRRLWELV